MNHWGMCSLVEKSNFRLIQLSPSIRVKWSGFPLLLWFLFFFVWIFIDIISVVSWSCAERQWIIRKFSKLHNTMILLGCLGGMCRSRWWPSVALYSTLYLVCMSFLMIFLRSINNLRNDIKWKNGSHVFRFLYYYSKKLRKANEPSIYWSVGIKFNAIQMDAKYCWWIFNANNRMVLPSTIQFVPLWNMKSIGCAQTMATGTLIFEPQ